MWPRLLGEEQARVVYGLEATTQELVYICGPSAVALIAGLAGARAAVIVSGCLGLVGALAYLTSPAFGAAVRPPARAVRNRVVRRSGVARYALVGVCLTLGFGMTEIATVDFVGGRQASASAGVVLAVWSAGSLVGGLLFGASGQQVTDRRLARVIGLVTVGLALAALSPGAIGLAVVLCCSGAAVAPTLARLYTRMGVAAGEGSTTEAFGWLAVGFLVGSSLGSALGGLSVDAVGSRWTFVVAATAALCAVPIALAGRQVTSLSARQAPDPDVARSDSGHRRH
jgi:predicted MFS family arabinose efflux permease